ncbi:MAG TPA: non-homologous end-joining DNA ligase [Solirubrobacteraceae bacterium]|jgi:bifunctional non-homologous end joining protein LigD|nr:non-homologous end-joining DNA ligase [Solirubrobacteraceae bacterium]
MSRNLDSYRRKRDFSATPEPSGGSESADERTLRFVVQEHHARSLHWDLRLEHDGVLASWAVPKGIPPDPRRNHLAVRTEDHPLEYLDFHGEIPEGEYGAGTMKIWDRGTYEEHKFREDEVMVTFYGERLEGRYVLFRTGGSNWMIHRMDPPQDPGREPMPEHVKPMLAQLGSLPDDDARWAYEVKWDGVRAIGYVEGGRLRLESRNGRDVTPRYPELRELGRALAGREAILDGEVVAFGDDGRPSFQKLQGRMHLTSEHAVRRLAASDPVAYLIFDLLWLDGHSLMDLPYLERRARLTELGLNADRWQTPAHHLGDGAALLEASRVQGLEGIIAKRTDVPYTPGRRSPAWVKVKNKRRTDVVIGGWLPGEGRRAERFGALVVGFYDDDGLHYAGRVGTGFNEAELARLQGILSPLERRTSPFVGRRPPRETHFVEPELVAAVDYGEWTQSRTLRHPVYQGLRDDIDPTTVRFDDS